MLHLHVVGIAVPQPDAVLILRMRLMVGIDSTAIVFLEVVVGLFGGQPVKGKLNVSSLIGISSEDTLDG